MAVWLLQVLACGSSSMCCHSELVVFFHGLHGNCLFRLCLKNGGFKHYTSLLKPVITAFTVQQVGAGVNRATFGHCL